MADGLQIVMLVCLGTVAFVGTVMNNITMYVLMRNKTLREKLSSVRWYMFGQSLSEALLCGIGAPVMFANLMIGMAPPFTTVPIICHSAELVGFGAGYVSMWYQTVIALTRLAAVVAPNWYRHYVRKRAATVALFSFPWLIGYIGYAVGALAHAYHIHPTPGSGTCVANEYDDSPEAADRFASYLISDTILHSWSSMSISLICYVIIYTKKWWSNWSIRHRQVHPIPNVPAASEINTFKSVHVAGDGTTDIAAHQTTANPAVLKVARKNEIERDQKIRLLAVSCIVNILLASPCNIIWGLGYYANLADKVPALTRMLDVMVFLTYPINPLLYLTVSKDFRQAFRETFRRTS